MMQRRTRTMKKLRLTSRLFAIAGAALLVFASQFGNSLAQDTAPEETFATPLVATTTSAAMQTDAATNQATTDGTFAEQMAVLVNQFRQQNNLPPLKIEPALTAAAQAYAGRLGSGNFFGHLDPDFNCNKPSERVVAAGYANWAAVGENIAAGYPSPQAAFDGWVNSAGHRANMLNAAYRDIGVGFFLDENDAANVRQNGNCPYTANNGGPYRFYWTQEFGARWRNGAPVLPIIINGEAVSTAQRQITLYIYGGFEGQPVWAKQMRFSENNTNWTPYEAWSATKTYTLSAGSGTKTLYVQLTNGATTQTSSDTITLADGSTVQPQPVPASLPARAFVPIVVR
jgi:uncharacterized protein YkwD